MRTFLLSILSLFLSTIIYGQEDSTLYQPPTPVLEEVQEEVEIEEVIQLEEEAIILPLDSAQADSLVDALDQMRVPSIDTSIYRTYEQLQESAQPRADLLATPDSVFMARLEVLNRNSPFRLDYNRHVRSALQGYVGKNHKLSGKMLGLAELYFPMFEEALDREGLPLELKYLAIVESALDPTARSRAGATGLWQFMYGTAKENGLTINSYIDERKSPKASTDAACKYLKHLHGIYDDWNLALAAYNSGPGNVNKAIRRAGGKKDYWEIWSHLPRETRGYVPAFIAVNYAMNYYAEHGIHPVEPEFRYSECDTIMVEGPMNFSQIAKFTGTDLDVLRKLNPHFHKDYIPKSSELWTLMLPIEDIGEFVQHEEEIKQYEAAKIVPSAAVSTYTASSRSNHYSTEGLVKKIYTVRQGDVIGVIADRHGVGLSKLRYWNNMSGSRINVGQKLVIYVPKGSQSKTSEQLSAERKKPDIPIDPSARYHTIRSGDTLWDIAKLYDGVTVTDIKNGTHTSTSNDSSSEQKSGYPANFILANPSRVYFDWLRGR